MMNQNILMEQNAIQYLRENYGIAISDTYQKHADYTVRELIAKPGKAEELLELQCRQMNDCPKRVAGTLFGKRYSVLAMGFFHALTEFALVLDTNPDHVGIKVLKNGCMGFIVPSSAVITLSELSPERKNELIRSFTHNHLQPLFQAVSNVCGNSLSPMFSLISHNLHQTALRLKNQSSPDVEMINTFLALMTSDPLLNYSFRLYNPSNGDQPYYIRKHCCLSYLTQGGDKSRCCGTCPLLSDHER